MHKDTFCSLPFTEIFLGPDTGIKSCCSSNTTLGFLNKNTIQEILQNDISQELRQSILDGKWHPACIQCKRQESQNVRSEREDNLDYFIEKHGNDIDKTYFKLTRLDLRWSNTCNLSCTYCYEYFSSKWAEIKGIKVNTVVNENEESLFLLIEQHKTSVENILMLGGEPLLQKQNSKLIEILSNKNFYMLTNLAVPLETNKIAQTLLKENNVHIGVSFETVRERYEYVRHNASWEVFDKNLDYIKSKRPEVAINSHSLYSIYSAFNLIEFYEYITNKNMFSEIFWNLLESSGENENSSIFKLSKPLKEKAIKEIDSVVANFYGAPGVDDLINIKSSLISSLDVDRPPSNKSFIVESELLCNLLKKQQGKHFQDLWPELYNNLIIDV